MVGRLEQTMRKDGGLACDVLGKSQYTLWSSLGAVGVQAKVYATADVQAEVFVNILEKLMVSDHEIQDDLHSDTLDYDNTMSG
jgi:hypothetical protein